MENKNHIKRSKKLFDPIRLIFLLLIFFSLSFTTITLSRELEQGDLIWEPGDNGLEWNQDGRRLDAEDSLHIVSPPDNDGNHEACEFENQSTSKDYFIPTRYEHEWTAVKSAADGNHDDLVLKGCSCNEVCGDGIVFHGHSHTCYPTNGVDCGSCPTLTRTCNDGGWDGNWSGFTASYCNSGSCQSGYVCQDNQCIQIDGNGNDCLTCDDLDGLASVNNGLNCGLGLDDGCGETIDCIYNCASDQVCATCPPGTDHMDCYIDPEGDNTKGTCSTDTDCNAVVDVEDINEQGRSFCVVPHEGADCPVQSADVGVSYEVRHINDECEIYYNGWQGCSGSNLSNEPPYWVTFDGSENETEMLADYDNLASDYIIESCTPDETNGGGGGGDDDEMIGR